MSKIQYRFTILTALLFVATNAWAQSQSPTIHGNVYGGGRMAAVTNSVGHTSSTADEATNTCTIDIYKGTIDGNVFGGNDITGDVRQPRYNADGTYNANATSEREGDNSAVVNIHNTCGETIKISEVYGGGNGYYTYCFTYTDYANTSTTRDYIINADALVAEPNLRWLFTQKAPDGGLEVKVYPADATEYTDANLVATYTVSKGASLTNVIPIAHNGRVTVGDDVLADNTQDKILVGEVYGGAKMAWLSGEGGVTINSGTIGKAFAGNNFGGVVQTTSLTINGTKKPATEPTSADFASFTWPKVGAWDDAEGNGFGIGEAYGGGNAVDVNTRALVYMEDGYVGTLFGGNNLADMSAVPTVHLDGGNIRTVYGGGNAGAMKGCMAGAIDVSEYLDNTLFLAYDELSAFKGKYNGGTKDFSTFCSNDSYLFFYGAETLVHQKNDATPLRIGTVYGGCRAADVLLSTYVRMSKADYLGNIYGGCDISGSVAKGGAATGTTIVGETYVTTAAMNVEQYNATTGDAHAVVKTVPANFPIINLASMVTMTGGTTSGNMFAGGNGDYTYTEVADNRVNVYHIGAEQTAENLLATINNTDYYRPWVSHAVAALEGGELLGNLYGGGNNATVGLPAIGETPAIEGRSYVFLGKTARGANYPTAGTQSAIYAGGKKSDVYGTVDVIVKAGCNLNALYAGNDISGQVKGTNRKNFLTDANPLFTPLYGGGTTYSGESLVAPYGNTNMVQTYVRVEGADATNNIPAAKIKTLFGGGNGDYDYTTTTSPYYGLAKPTQHSCWLDIKGDVETSYGGGNAAEVAISNTYITANATVGTAFAGGNSATITETANLWLDCDGARGTQDYVDGTDNTKIPNVGTIFGGNNLADMNIVPKVQLWRGSVQTVYGGGNQGSMKGVRPYMVDLKEYVSGNWFNGNYPLYSSDKVLCFKGTNLVIDSKYEQTPDHTPTANPCGLVIGDVYAGCRAANVDNSSYVRVSHCDYIRNVYGGCDIAGSVGMYPGYFPSNSPYRDAAQTGKVKFYHLNSNYVVQEVYKEVPENAPMVNPTSCVLFTGGTVSGNIYGSGNGAYEYVEDGNIVKVYAFGVTQNDANLLASYDKTKLTKPFTTVTTVQIAGGTVMGNVYGGGNMAEVGRIVTTEDVTMHTAAGYESADGGYKLFPSWTTTLINGSTTFPEHYVKVGDEISAISNVFLGKSETGRSDVVINGNVYGGGRMADVHGAMDILALKDVTINSLFAGNDIAGSVLGTSRVSRFTPNTDYTTLIGDENDRATILNTSFSGVTLTADNANTYVRVMPGAKITNLYGGGNGYYYYEANGGKVDVYARNADGTKNDAVSYGSVNAASVEKAKPVQQSTLLDVAGHVTTAYGGGNAADIGTSNLYIVKNAQVETAFAGGNAATVTEEANLYVNCNPALFKEGANTTSGHGYIIDETVHNPTTTSIANNKYNVGTLFGGNNVADMAIVPNVQLFHGKIGKAYGGGNQGNMTGVDGFLLGLNTYLNDSWLTSWTDLKQTIDGKESGFQMSRFPVFISTNLTLDASSASAGSIPEGYTANTGLRVDELYGGCKAANVNNSSYVRISAADYVGDVYGGCDVAGAVGVGPMNNTGLYTAPRDLKCKVYDNVSEKDVYAEDWTFPTSPETDRNYTVKAGTVMRYISTYVTVTSGTIQGKVYGGGNGAYDYTSSEYSAYASNKPWVSGANVIIEGGTFNEDVYLGGNAATVGKDYTGESSKPTYYGIALPGDGNYLALPSHLLIGNSVRSTDPIQINKDVYCGGRMADVYASVDALVKTGVHINQFYAGNDISGQVNGSRSVYRDVAGSPYPKGTDLYGGDQEHPEHTYYSSTLSNENAPVYVRIEPNAQIGTLFGGGNGDYNYADGEYASLTKPYQKASWLDVRGKIGTVYGGGNAANNGNTAIYIMGEAEIGTTETPGAVYGGCKSADVEHRTNVTVASFTPQGGTKVSPTINGNVFGGCDISGNVGMGDASYKGRLDIDNPGTFGYAKVTVNGANITGRVFGGGNGLQSASGTAYYTADASAANNGLTMVGSAPNETYQYPNGTYQGKTLPQVENTWLSLQGCTIGTTPGSETHTIFGGGQGAGTRVIHNVELHVGDDTNGSTVKTLVNGISYGGSYAGLVNTDCDDHTRTKLLGYELNTQIKGDVYGGSYGNSVRGKILVDVNGVKVGVSEASPAGIYAGNNAAGQSECEASINYVGDDCNVTLYGGSNEAPFYGTTRITFTTGKVGYIYGGGNHAPVYGNTIVEILGGEVCHDVFGGGNIGAVRVNKAKLADGTTDNPNNSYGKDYGGNTLVIVRDDCLELGPDAAGKNPGEDGYVATFKADALTGNRFANRGTTSYFNTNADGTEMSTKNDPYTSDKQMYILKPNASGKKSEIEIGGNVFGGGNAADVEGKATVIIGNKLMSE